MLFDIFQLHQKMTAIMEQIIIKKDILNQLIEFRKLHLLRRAGPMLMTRFDNLPVEVQDEAKQLIQKDIEKIFKEVQKMFLRVGTLQESQSAMKVQLKLIFDQSSEGFTIELADPESVELID